MIEKWEGQGGPEWKEIFLSAGGKLGWKIVAFDTTRGRATNVELRYRWSAEQSFEVGRFDGLAEAMYAADLYDDGPDFSRLEADAREIGLKPCEMGARKDVEGGFFTLVDGLDDLVGASYQGEGDGVGLHAYLSSSRRLPMYRLPNVEDHVLADCAVALEMIRFRLSRGAGRYAEPMTADELDGIRAGKAGSPPAP